MNIFLIYLIILILAGFITYFFLKTIIKTIFIIFLIFLLLSLFTTFSLTKEINSIKSNFPSSTNLFLLENNNEYLAGFYFNIKSSEFTYISEEELLSFQKKNLNEIKPYKEFYKIIKINYNYLKQSLPELLEYENIIISKTDFNIQINSENPLDYYIYENDTKQIIVSEKPNQSYFLLSETFNSSLEYKNNLFLLSFQSIENQKGLLNFLILGLKSNQIFIYKETFSFKLIQSIPKSILEK